MIAALAALALVAAAPDSGADDAGVADAGATDAGLVEDAGAQDAGVIQLLVCDPDSLDGGCDGGRGPETAPTFENPAVAVEDAGPAPAPQLPPLDFASPTSFRVSGEWRTKVLIDANFESRPGEPLAENVAEEQSHATLGATADFGERAKVVAEVRLWHRAVEQRPPPGQRFWLFNGQNAKATFEAQPGEAFLDLYTKYVDLRFGNQVLSFGANATGAPADALDPYDIREGVFFADDPSDVKLPVLAARARGTLFDFDWMVAYVPFFVPNRYDLYGQDEALLQPNLGQAVPAFPLLTLAQQDRAEQPIIETDRPKDLPQNGDLGLRVTHKLGDFTVGGDYVISREKFPEVTVDPELARFLNEGPSANFTDPATSLSLSQRIGAGEQLVHGQFPRYAIGELEASALVGPVQVDADVGHSASRLFVDTHLNPVFHALSTATLTVSDARGTDLTLAATMIALWVHDIPQGEALELLDPASASAGAHQTIGGALALLAGYRFLEDRLDAEARFFFDPRQRSYAVGGRAQYNLSDRVHFLIGYQRFSGPAQSPFGYFRRNDAGWGEVRLDL